MDIVKTVELTEVGAFLLYRAIACDSLILLGFKNDAWKETAAYDFSFQELLESGADLEMWDSIIMHDATEYKKSDPDSFESETAH